MNRKLLSSVGGALLLLVAFCGLGWAQGPRAKIVVEGLSPQQLEELGWTTPPSSGLRVVGKGQLVYLSGHEVSGEQVTSYTWSLASVPQGSAAALDSVNTQWTTFIPDTTGQFVVQLSITTGSGSADTTVTIIAAKYLGVGIVDTLAADPSKGECAPCHTSKISDWTQTGHATMFKEAIDGLKSSHYNESCIQCHTVGYDTLATADNDGFDDVAKKLGWTFPDTLQPGNWTDLATNFPDLARRANIQCENCHGPASLHKQNIDPTKIDLTLDEKVCGRCHEEEPYHRKPIQWRRSAHAVGVSFAANREECAGCHSGYGFVNRFDSDRPFEVNTGFPQVTCQVCHDPHSAANEHQLRSVGDITLNNGETISFGSIGKFCMNCHLSRRDAASYAQQWHPHFGPHHSNQADMLAGTNAITFGMHIPSSNHKNVVPEACVTCHMADTPATGDPGHDFVGEHTFAMSWDGGTPDDPTDDVDNVAACRQCHGDISSFEDIKAKEDYDGDGIIESAQDEVRGLLDEVGKLLPPLGDPSVALELNPTTDPNYTSTQLLAAYDYLFVKEDGSFGVHNFQYAVNLLKVAHQALTTGDIGSGMIESITDIPNDQGKQVRVVWNRFGGDGVGENPVKFYAVWRRVDDAPLSASRTTYALLESLEGVPANPTALSVGTRVMAEGHLWDFVGSVPAAGQDRYSAVVPTLFDSTKVDGMHWSVFFVSGHTAVPALYAVSQPDSGYSVDNLAPAPPANVVAEETDSGVRLAWDKPVDNDFKYFAIYRGTTQGFDPGATEPLATLTETTYTDASVKVGTTYYYRLAAFDFSGNRSRFSKEVPVVVTSVEAARSATVPSHYVLNQNYPNPFNPSTAIRFGVPTEGDVSLVIYDLMGTTVRTLAVGRFSPGYHTVVWDGRDDAGQIVPTGVYIYRLKAKGATLTRKLMFVK